MKKLVFTASMDKTTKIMTVVVVLLVVGLSLLTLFVTKDIAVRPIWVFLPSFVIMGVAYAWAPQHYEIHPDKVVVARLIGKVDIPRKSITHVSLPGKLAMKGTLRTFGVGGFFGYYGRFYNSTLGKMTWYVTHRSQLVLLAVEGRKIMVSPDDVSLFVGQLGFEVPDSQSVVKN